MTPVRWILVGALTLGLGGIASAQESPAPRTCPTQGTCPAGSESKPCCAVWQFVLRLGGVGVGVSAQKTTACTSCQQSHAEKATGCSSCNAALHEVVGQCAQVGIEEVCETRSGCCTGCPACTHPKATAGSCPCASGTCADASPCTGERILHENVVILGGSKPQFVPATPVAVSRIAVDGNHVVISSPTVKATGETYSITCQATESPLQISVSGRQLQISTPTMKATCDRLTGLPTGPGHVLIEGNVRITYHATQSPTRVEAERIIVDLKNNEFKVMAENGAVRRPAQHIGLWYAPNPMPMMFPPIPPMPSIAYPHPMPMPTPVSRPTAPAVYYQATPSSPSR